MRGFLIAVSVLVSVVILGVFTARVVAWKRYVDKRSFYAEQTGVYLFGPSGVVLSATGEPLTRQQLLDNLLHQAVDHSPALAVQKK